MTSTIRARIIADQTANAKRDKKALATEARWYRKAAAEAAKAGNAVQAAAHTARAEELEAMR